MSMVVTQTKQESGKNDVSTDWLSVVRALGPTFAARADAHDADDTFVAANYDELKEKRLFSGGRPSRPLAGAARRIARCATCSANSPATARRPRSALSMHSAPRRGYRLEISPRATGRGHAQVRVAKKELVLVSTGARDWLASNGEAKKVDGGYRVSARESLCERAAEPGAFW